MAAKQTRSRVRPSQQRIRSRWQRERGRQRRFLIGGLAAILVILAIPAYGYYDTFVEPPRQWVVKVNDESFNMGYLIKLLRMFQAGDVTGQGLNLASLPFELVNTMAENELIRQGAPRLDISATSSEIDGEIRQRIVGDTSGEQTAPAELERNFQELYREYLNLIQINEKEHRQIVHYDLLREKLQENLGQQVERVQPQVHLFAIQLPTLDNALELAEEVRTEFIRGTSIEELVERPDLDQSAEAVRKGGEIGWLPKGVADQINPILFEELEVGVLSDPISSFDSAQGQNLYTIYLVKERAEAREVEEIYLELLKRIALKEWLNRERETNEVLTRMDSTRYEWIVKQLRLSAPRQ